MTYGPSQHPASEPGNLAISYDPAHDPGGMTAGYDLGCHGASNANSADLDYDPAGYDPGGGYDPGSGYGAGGHDGGSYDSGGGNVLLWIQSVAHRGRGTRHILRTTNAGTSWHQVDSPTIRDLHSISAPTRHAASPSDPEAAC